MGRSVATTTSSGSGVKKYPTIATYTSSQTITLPTGVTEVYAILAGGGGAGCRGVDNRFWGAGGGGGGVTAVLLDTSSTSSITITVGAGGTPNANGSGSRGGTTTLVYNGITYAARGGEGGQYTRNNGRGHGGQGGPIVLNANPGSFGTNIVTSGAYGASPGTSGFMSGGFHGMTNTDYSMGITGYSLLSGAGGGGDTGNHAGKGQDGLTGGGGTDGYPGGSSLMFGRTNGLNEMGGAGLLGTSNSNNTPYHGGGSGGGGGAAGQPPSSGGNQGGEGGVGCVILYY